MPRDSEECVLGSREDTDEILRQLSILQEMVVELSNRLTLVETSLELKKAA